MQAMGGLNEEESIAGVFDGSWGIIDAVHAMLGYTGFVQECIIAAWITSGRDGNALLEITNSPTIGHVHFITRNRTIRKTESFIPLIQKRQKGTVTVSRWNGHAKFVIMTGGTRMKELLFVTSANLRGVAALDTWMLTAQKDAVHEFRAQVGRELKTPTAMRKFGYGG